MCFGWLILECVFNGWLASLGVMVGDGSRVGEAMPVLVCAY